MQTDPTPAPLFYVRAAGGLSIMPDMEETEDGVTYEAEFDLGYAISAAAGYQFSRYARLEGEFLYFANDLDTLGGTDGTTTVSFAANGDASVMAFMANAVFDLSNDTIFTPYVFGGLGYAESSINDVTVLGVNIGSESEWNLAWQAGVGLTMDLGDRFALDASYRYFHTEFDSSDVVSHILMAGGRFKF